MPIPTYRAPKDSQPWGLLGAIGNFISPPGYAARGPRGQLVGQKKPSIVPISSDQLPPGAYMTEDGRVFGMSSSQVPQGGYMTEPGRVFVPAGWSPSRTQPAAAPLTQPSSGLRPAVAAAPITTGFGAAPAERAYQAEKSRVSQLTAQDPELQRYEAARKIAVGPGATPEQVQSAEDIGMQMWAKKNPTLAAKVAPGQAGYEAIQGTLAGNAARTGAGFKLPEQLVPTPTGFPTAAPGMPQAAPKFDLSTAFSKPGVLDEATLKRFSDILLQSAK